MKAGQGAIELPAWEGEDASDYIVRLAIRLGYIKPGVEPKSMPEIRLPYAEPREPGEDDE